MKGGGDIHGCSKLEIKYFIIKNGSVMKIEPFFFSARPNTNQSGKTAKHQNKHF